MSTQNSSAAPVKRQFLSLKWRIAFLLSAGLLLIGLSFFYFNHHALRDYSSNQRSMLNARSDQEFLGLLEREGQDLQRLGEFIPALPGIRSALASGEKKALQAAFSDIWPTLELDYQVEAVNFYAHGGELLQAFESAFLGQTLPPVDAALLARAGTLEQPLSTIICAQSCGHYALIPVLAEGRGIGTIVLASGLGNLLRSFSQLSGNQVGLLLHRSASDPQRSLPEWNAEIAALGGGAEALQLLREVARQHPQFPADGSAITVSNARGTFSTRLLPLTDARQENVAWLVSIADVSAQQQLVDGASRAALLLLGAMLLFAELGLLLMLRRPMQRLQQTARSLPLLAQRRYQEVSEAISEPAADQHHDEIDVLDSATLELCSELEGLEQQVQARNRELADKVSELAQQRERYALAARGANDGLWDWDLLQDSVYYSPRWKQMSGYREGEIGDSPDDWLGRIHPQDSATLRTALDAHLAGGSTHFECEYRLLQADQSYRWMLSRALAVRDASGKPQRIAGSQTDIHARLQVQEQLQHDALHDALTRLPNRLLFMDRLKQALANAHRSDDSLFAVLYVDLDRFKIINDSMGHAAGDQLLIAVSRRFKQVIRPADTVARMGGDEFALIINGLQDRQALFTTLGRIQQQIARPIDIDGREVFTSLSTGVAFYGEDYRRPEDMLRDADTAMYHAKKAGTNRYAEFDASMHARALTLMAVQEELKHALRHNELLLHYQPIFDLESGQTTGFESLLRWNHPRRGLLPPGEFLPVAEETELMEQLGDWVLDAVCLQMIQWHQQLGDRRCFCVNINLDASHLMQDDFPQQLSDTLHRHGVEPRWIKIEITENMLLDNTERAVDVLRRIRALGVGVCIDDFGTGYSSLSYLSRLPIDTLKIDRAFVSVLDAQQPDLSIVRAIITLAHSLEMDVVAEGIETDGQRQALRELDCDRGQGYLYARPMEAEKVPGFLASQDGKA